MISNFVKQNYSECNNISINYHRTITTNLGPWVAKQAELNMPKPLPIFE